MTHAALKACGSTMASMHAAPHAVGHAQCWVPKKRTAPVQPTALELNRHDYLLPGLPGADTLHNVSCR